MRLGNTASAPFLGSQFASLYLGAVRVPTVPSKPTITSANVLGEETDIQTDIFNLFNDGGSNVTSVKLYIDGVFAGALFGPWPADLTGSVIASVEAGGAAPAKTEAVAPEMKASPVADEPPATRLQSWYLGCIP